VKKVCPICKGKLKLTEFDREAYVEGTLVGYYKEKHLVCQDCYARVFDDEIDEENRHNKNEFWRKYFNLISQEDINRLPRKLKTSRAVVAKALNISAKGPMDNLTVWDGELPTEDESERMLKALNDPNYFLYCAKKNGVDEETLAEVRARNEK